MVNAVLSAVSPVVLLRRVDDVSAEYRGFSPRNSRASLRLLISSGFSLCFLWWFLLNVLLCEYPFYLRTSPLLLWARWLSLWSSVYWPSLMGSGWRGRGLFGMSRLPSGILFHFHPFLPRVKNWPERWFRLYERHISLSLLFCIFLHKLYLTRLNFRQIRR